MNYIEVYNSLCERGKTRSRKDYGDFQLELHHITPSCLYKKNKRNKTGELYAYQTLDGNPNDKNNLTYLTPREHFIAHMLLYKHYKDDPLLSTPMMLSLMLLLRVANDKSELYESVCSSRMYQIARQIISAEQSDNMIGRIIVRNLNGTLIGKVSVDHPKVLSGEWVHHNRGRKATQEESEAKSARSSGTNNNNYKSITDEDMTHFYRCLSECSHETPSGNLVNLQTFVAYIKQDQYFMDRYRNINTGITKPISTAFVRQRLGGFDNLLDMYHKESGLKPLKFAKSILPKNREYTRGADNAKSRVLTPELEKHIIETAISIAEYTNSGWICKMSDLHKQVNVSETWFTKTFGSTNDFYGRINKSGLTDKIFRYKGAILKRKEHGKIIPVFNKYLLDEFSKYIRLNPLDNSEGTIILIEAINALNDNEYFNNTFDGPMTRDIIRVDYGGVKGILEQLSNHTKCKVTLYKKN